MTFTQLRAHDLSVIGGIKDTTLTFESIELRRWNFSNVRRSDRSLEPSSSNTIRAIGLDNVVPGIYWHESSAYENKKYCVALFFPINPIVLMRSLRENYSRIEKKMFPMTIWRAKSIYFLSLIRNERFTEFAVRVFHDGYWEITEKVWKTDYTSIKQIVMLENPIYIEVFTGMKYWWKSVHVTDG